MTLSDRQHERPSAEAAAAAFGLLGPAETVAHKEHLVIRIGDAVLRGEDDPEMAVWIAETFAAIEERGFRVAHPLQTTDGSWLANNRWSAWTWLPGNPLTQGDVAAGVAAVEAFHAAVATVDRPPFLDRISSPFAESDQAAWGTALRCRDAGVARLVERLYDLRKPVPPQPDQLIHGDLNPSNFLVTPGAPPAIIDMAPYWRPAGFALAVMAFWLLYDRPSADVLRPFAHVEALDQLLVRAALRMLLTADSFGTTQNMGTYEAAVEVIAQLAARQ